MLCSVSLVRQPPQRSPARLSRMGWLLMVFLVCGHAVHIITPTAADTPAEKPKKPAPDPHCIIDKTDINFNIASSFGCDMTEENPFSYGPSKTFHLNFYWCAPAQDTEVCPKAFIGQETASKHCARNFNSMPSGMTLTDSGVSYTVYDASKNQAVVSIKCDKTVSTFTCPSSYKVSNTAGNIQYTFELTSSWACKDVKHVDPNQTSSTFPKGAIFLIIVFVGSFLYLTIGFAINYKRNDLRGVDAIPQIEYWKELPGLVKDGCMFTLDGCKTGVARIRGKEYQPV